VTHRIVSLIPSATEIVCALGLRDQLVGRSHECDFPPGVESLPVCCEPYIDIQASSAEINTQVKERLQQAASIFKVDRETINCLKPTVIITQTQCDVCAVDLDEVEKTLCETIDSNPQLVACEPHQLWDIWQDILHISQAVGLPDAGRELVNRLRKELHTLKSQAEQLDERPSIVCIEWIEPPMAAGNWVPELVEVAGGTNLFGTAGEHSPWLDWEAFLESDTDAIVIVPCGFTIDRTQQELGPLFARPGWQELRAVQEGRVAIADGHNFFNRPGPRVLESAQILAEILHPEEFRFGHRGNGWIPLEK
jgi:iron complex transport system substrate-binding protein